MFLIGKVFVRNLIFNSKYMMDSSPHSSLDLLSLPLINLLICLGYEEDNLPLADWLVQYYQLEGEWVVLNPVTWLATHNNATITAYGGALDASDEELRSLFDSLSQYLAPTDFKLHYHDAYTWLLSTTKKSCLNAKSIHHIAQKPLIHELGGLDNTLYWQQFLTEMQLFFASKHPTSAVNGVWVWSTSALARKKSISIGTNHHYLAWTKCCSDKVGLYDPEKNTIKFDIVLLDDWSELSILHQEQLKSATACWYWNDLRYQSVATSWFSRFWRKYIHAH